MPRLVEDVEHLDLGVGDGVGVVVGVGAGQKGLAVLVVQLLDHVLLPFQDVDGLGVQRFQGVGKTDLGDHPLPVGAVDDHEVVGSDAVQADGVGRVALLGPEPLVVLVQQHLVLGQVGEDLLQVLAAEAVALGEGQLEGGALDVVDEHGQVVGVDAPHLRATGRRSTRDG